MVFFRCEVGDDGEPDLITKTGKYNTDNWKKAAQRAARQVLKGDNEGEAVFFVVNKENKQAVKVKAKKQLLKKPKIIKIAGKPDRVFKYETIITRHE